MLEIGSKFGDYTVIELLGKGSMGEVYRITNGSTDYALKIMSAKFDDAQKVHEWRKRFAREAEVAMKVRHKNLIEVYDVGEDPETHLCYILMEYVGGGTLTDRLKAKGKLEIREAVAITMHIASALSAAHSIGIVHRDIKPDNIMFTTDGVPKLADLGIARWTGSDGDTTVTKTEMIVGTPAYMSPEQMLNSHNVDSRADIYSLGIVFYEMLTGLRPNQGSTIVELMAKAIKGEELPDVRELRPEVSAALACALSRMVAQKAELRPQSAAEAARLVYDAATGKMTAKTGVERVVCEETQSRIEGRNKGARRFVAFLGVASAVVALVVALIISSDRAPRHAGVPQSEQALQAATAVVGKKTTVLIPRFDQNSVAWAYSFNREDGWEKPEFDDRRWKRAPGGFGCRYEQSHIRWGVINTEWRTKNIFLRRHFKWEGGEVSRAMFEIFHDDGVKVSLNGQTVLYKGGAYSWWMHYECPAARFNRALRKGDNVICFEVENGGGPAYFDAGLFVEKGGQELEYYDVDEVRRVTTKDGTWTVKIDDGIAQIGNGSDKALVPEPMGELEIPSELDGFKIRKIGQNAFRGCGNLTRVKIPEGVNTLGHGAFSSCSELEEISIPESLEYMESKVIFQSRKVKKLDIKNVRLLWDEAFDACSLEEIKVNPGNPVYYMEDGVLYDRVRRGVVIVPRSCTSYTVPDGIETIYSEAFQNSKIKSLVLPESVRLFGTASCNSCPEIESIEFMCDTCSINGWSMPDCPKLRRVVLPREIKWLDDAMFANDISLESIDIPDSMTRIGADAFSGCTRLKNVKVGKSVEHISVRAFQFCRSLESIVLPASLKTTDDRVFKDCRALKAVHFKGDAPQVGERFYENANPDLVTYVRRGSKGWNGPGSTNLPEKWPVGDTDARPIRYMDDDGTDDARRPAINTGDTSDWQKGPTDAWFVEWDKALDEARKTGKKIFALNTGSDWCGWCMRLKADVLDKDEFTNFAKDNLVLLYLDSPNRKPLGKEQKAHNKQIVRALGFGGGVPSSMVFSADGVKLGGIGGGGQKVEAYIGRIKDILAKKGESFRSDDSKILFNEGYAKLAFRSAEERAKLPPVTKDDFKAQLTGVAVCSGANRNYDNLDFKPPTTHLEVEPDEKVVLRIEHDFPQGYAAAVWVRGEGSVYSNPSGRYLGKGVEYGYLGLYNAKEDVTLSSIEITTNSEPELDECPRGWTICSQKVDLVFLAKPSGKPDLGIAAPAEKVAEANGYHWFYRVENGKAILCRRDLPNGRRPCIEPIPEGKVVVPKVLDGHRVVAIDDCAFYDCDKMTEVVLPEGLEALLGCQSFGRCHGLTEVVFPKSLKRCETLAFDSCANLKRVNIMNCDRSDGGFGCFFDNCRALEEILCSRKNPVLTSIDGALYSKDKKTLIAYPKTRKKLKLLSTVRNISNTALVSIPLKHVKIPEGVEFVDVHNFEFDDDGVIETVEFPKSLKKLGASQFKGTSTPKKVIFNGDAPELYRGSPFAESSADVVVYVRRGSKGWNGPGSTNLPEQWPVDDPDARPIRYIK